MGKALNDYEIKDAYEELMASTRKNSTSKMVMYGSPSQLNQTPVIQDNKPGTYLNGQRIDAPAGSGGGKTEFADKVIKYYQYDKIHRTIFGVPAPYPTPDKKSDLRPRKTYTTKDWDQAYSAWSKGEIQHYEDDLPKNIMKNAFTAHHNFL